MLLRSDERGTLLIGQPSHAWISGQLARAWGNDEFGRVEPYEEVCLAAEQHDVGMADWDLAPERNPDTGLPRSFMEMPIPVHVELWTQGPRRLLRQSRYAALLASMHGTRLYRLRDVRRLAPQDAEAVVAFVTGQTDFQQQLIESLRADPATAESAAPEQIQRNSQLLWTWDSMSLALCLDWAPWTATEVPTAISSTSLKLAPTATAKTLTLDPWPLRSSTLKIHCDGQLLTGTFADDASLAEALERAPWERLELELRPLSAAPPG
jgi:hypothetical protein